MRKISTLLLALGAIVALLAGCQSASTTASFPACCQAAAEIQDQIPACCTDKMAGTDAACCGEGMECCDKTAALMAAVPGCCKDAVLAGKDMPCCDAK